MKQLIYCAIIISISVTAFSLEKIDDQGLEAISAKTKVKIDIEQVGIYNPIQELSYDVTNEDDLRQNNGFVSQGVHMATDDAKPLVIEFTTPATYVTDKNSINIGLPNAEVLTESHTINLKIGSSSMGSMEYGSESHQLLGGDVVISSK